MTDATPNNDLEKRAKQNEEESAAAMRMAHEAKMRDEMAGVPTNPAQLQTSIADKIKGKLERDEFHVFVDDNGNPVPPSSQDE